MPLASEQTWPFDKNWITFPEAAVFLPTNLFHCAATACPVGDGNRDQSALINTAHKWPQKPAFVLIRFSPFPAHTSESIKKLTLAWSHSASRHRAETRAALFSCVQGVPALKWIHFRNGYVWGQLQSSSSFVNMLSCFLGVPGPHVSRPSGTSSPEQM